MNGGDSSTGIVADRGERGLRDFFRSEDTWAIWLGFFYIVLSLCIYLPHPPDDLEAKLADYDAILRAESKRAPFRTLEWYAASDAKGKLKATGEPHGRAIKRWTGKPHGWSSNPLQAFFLSRGEAAQRAQAAKQRYERLASKTAELRKAAEKAEREAEQRNFEDPQLNEAAREAIADYRAHRRTSAAARKKAATKPYNQLGYLVGFGLAIGLVFAIGMQVMRGKGPAFLLGFPFVFFLSVLAYFIAAQSEVKAAGIGYAAWAILIGLLVSNTVGTPKWVMPAVQVEYYIKTGLVLLGAEILFGKVFTIGVPGVFVSWVVTPIVLIATYWFGQRVIKLTSKTLNITLAADMSVCGVSAAIATAAACRARKEELTLAVGISLIFTSIMMIVMPNVIKALGMDHVLGGAWMGGTIDATGAVAAAGAFLSDRALYVAATIKMIQNILIGVIAFGVAVYWVTRVESNASGTTPSAVEIWVRFPKFVLGFVIASILFSLLYEYLGDDKGAVLLSHGAIRGGTKILRGWFFCLAFVSIGLSTNFRALSVYLKGGKPVALYLCGQALNLVLTLLVAYLMFYVVFPQITQNI